MKRTKRILSFVMAIMMMFTVYCADVFAVPEGAAPTVDNLSVYSISQNGEGYYNVQVTWSGTADSYAVYLGNVKKGTTAKRTYTLKKLPAGDIYTVKVEPRIHDGEESVLGEVKTVKVMTAMVKGSGRDMAAKLSWDKIDGVDAYQVNVYEKGNPTSIGKKSVVWADRVEIGQLQNYKEYQFSVTANGVESVKSDMVTPKPVPEDVEYLHAYPGFQSVCLEWPKVEDADGYVIERKGPNDSEYELLTTSWDTEFDNARVVKSGTVTENFKYNKAGTAGKDYTFNTLEFTGEKDENIIKYRDKTVKKFQEYTATDVAGDLDYSYRVYAALGDRADYVTSENPAEDAGQCVRSAGYVCKIKQSKTLKKHGGDGPSTYQLKAGSTMLATGYTSGTYTFRYKGSIFWFARIRTSSQKIDYIRVTDNSKADEYGWTYEEKKGSNYSPETALNYVTDMGCTSPTPYLVWANLYCQHAYFFKRADNGWKLIGDWEVASGLAKSPSPNGTTKAIHKHWRSHHGIPWWSCFSSDNAFHGMKEYGAKGNQVGTPASGGCLRNQHHTANYIYKSVVNYTKSGKKTKAVVF